MTTVLKDETKELILEESESKVGIERKKLFSIGKRVFDLIASICVMPIAFLFILAFGILIKIEDGGSVFYTQKRVGRDLKEFNIYKLRSMRMDAEKDSGSVWAEINDPRVTKIGSVIRKYRIDELPQFLNVIKGEMSIIGPRPERLDLTLNFNEEIPGFVNRLKVRPGITGLAQVSGGYDISPNEKFRFDKIYISNFGIKQEIMIILKTIRVIITGEGSR